MSHELRTDVLTGRQVIVAPVRSERPGAFVPDPELSRGLDPFAEGQEHETPDEWFASRTADSIANKPGWSLRVVPNRYPLLTTEASATADEHGSALFPTALVPGVHDVVIECPDQRSRLAELSTAELANVLTAWRMRLSQLSTTGEYSSVVVFRNEGFSAGASLKHCHSQIVAMRSLTMIDQERMRRESMHRQATGHGLLQSLLDAERRAATRIVAETAHFVVLCPFASRASWHLRFVPTPCNQSLIDTDDLQLVELASLLQSASAALERCIGGPFSFNLLLTHPPLNQLDGFNWMLDLIPRTGRIAGWELMTDIDIASVAPEHAAEAIRAAWKK